MFLNEKWRRYRIEITQFFNIVSCYIKDSREEWMNTRNNSFVIDDTVIGFKGT